MSNYEQVKNLLNMEKSAEFLGVHKPGFYKILKAHDLQPKYQIGRIKLYAMRDLKRIKKLLTPSLPKK